MADETNLYKFDGTKYVKVTQPSGAEQQLLVDNTGGSLADYTLAVVPYGGASFYCSTPGAAQAVTAAALFGGAGFATTQIEVSNFTHASPGRLTYVGTPTTDFHVLATGSVTIAAAAERITFNIHRNGTVVNAGFAANIEAAGVGDVLSFCVQADVELTTNQYIELYINTDGTSVNITPVSYVMHVTASDINEKAVVSDNFAKLARLVNALRAAAVSSALIKGNA